MAAQLLMENPLHRVHVAAALELPFFAARAAPVPAPTTSAPTGHGGAAAQAPTGHGGGAEASTGAGNEAPWVLLARAMTRAFLLLAGIRGLHGVRWLGGWLQERASDLLGSEELFSQLLQTLAVAFEEAELDSYNASLDVLYK